MHLDKNPLRTVLQLLLLHFKNKRCVCLYLISRLCREFFLFLQHSAALLVGGVVRDGNMLLGTGRAHYKRKFSVWQMLAESKRWVLDCLDSHCQPANRK